MELTPEDIELIFQWFSWAENEGSMCAYGPEAEALTEKLKNMRGY